MESLVFYFGLLMAFIAIGCSAEKWRTALFILRWSFLTSVAACVAAIVELYFLNADNAAGAAGRNDHTFFHAWSHTFFKRINLG